MIEVAVVGGGPAGWALAGACARRGLRTALIDPRPRRPWRATYAAWSDELPAGTPASSLAARIVASTEHSLDRRYAVLDNAALLAQLDHPALLVLADRVVGVEHDRRGSTARLAGGPDLSASVVVHCGGARRAEGGAEQTAFGVVLPAAAAAPLVSPGEALVMDWRPSPGPLGRWPTFLYGVPLAGDRVLLEETSLARRPGLPLGELRRRLTARLAAHGVDAHGFNATALAHERVRFTVDPPLPRPGRVPRFGAAAAMVHPATGYGVAAALRTAPAVADAIAAALPRGPVAAARAAHRAVWPPAARTVHRLRRRGLAALLALPPEDVAEFFELFFTLPERRQRAYLSDRLDVAGTVGAMVAVFRSAGWSVRAELARHTLTAR
ncbi:lycopene cyclase family protein [Solihabitans fulvus]|uniref:Lycopene cyclase family protein n=1 Tax=Solihabitans fulvus TaxID=1892852 RepID=A0A5B2XDE4_9PSEU|nr:lycopene cyclase family protein [Solihabitans fulvus]KAA2261687.1 lycopene cyclase family protein [Solihabitans fulvus]